MPKYDTTGKGQNTTNSADPVAFLRDFDPEGRFNLVAIDPETAFVTGRTFAPRSWDEMRAWVAERNGRQNLYFTVNEPHPTAPDKKLLKDDIAAIRAVYVDADPHKDKPFDDERRRLLDLAKAAQSSPCPPTFVVDSGGGVQFFWRLAEKLPASEHRQWAEEQGRGLAHAVGGDAVQNIDRIMRLPGTVNIPDAKKRARGRTEAGARLVAANSATYTPDDLSSYAAPRSPDSDNMDSAEDIAAIQRTLDMQAIAAGPDQCLLSRLAKAADADPRLRAILDGQPLKGDDQSGSAYRAALVARLCENGTFTPTEYASIATSLDCCNTNKEVPGGWPRQFAREWCNIGMKHAVERWFAPIPDIGLNPFEVQHTKQTEQRQAEQDPDRFRFLSFNQAVDEALADGSAPLIKGLLDQGAMSVLYGDSNAGKTFVALDIAYHVWQGVPYAGMRTAQGAVVYVAAEGGRGVKRRLRALAVERNPKELPGFDVLPCSVNLLDPEIDLNAFIEAIRRLATKPALIVIDTLARAMAGGDENASTDMGAFVRNVDAIRAATGAHLMVIHHTGKDKAKGARGHSSLRAATDTELEVERGSTMDGKPGGTLTANKQRDMEGGTGLTFALRTVPLGFDGEGDPVTSAVAVVSPGEGEEVLKEATTTEEAVMDCLRLVLSASPDAAGGVTVSEVHKAYGKGQVSTTRTHLRNLAKKGHVVSPQDGYWALKSRRGVVENASTTPSEDEERQSVPVEGGRKAGRNVFG